MKYKDEKAIVTTDIILSILAIMIFSTLIISLMFNNKLENVKLKQYGLAIADITETFEKVGIADYEEVTADNTNLLPTDIENHNIKMELEVVPIGEEGILKKVTAKVSYKILNKIYEFSMERMKIKE